MKEWNRDKVLEFLKDPKARSLNTFCYDRMEGVDLSCENLSDIDFSHTNLNGVNLKGANLRYADLTGADLTNAILNNQTDFKYAKLDGAKGLEAYRIVPEEGSFIGWKKVSLLSGFRKNENMYCGFEYRTCTDAVLKLEIPKHAKRVNAYGSRKCRSSSARVLSVLDAKGKRPIRLKEKDALISPNAYTNCAKPLLYAPGKLMRADSFDPDPRVECSNGIHFFMTKQEAINW